MFLKWHALYSFTNLVDDCSLRPATASQWNLLHSTLPSYPWPAPGNDKQDYWKEGTKSNIKIVYNSKYIL